MRFSVFALASAASATVINLAERGLSGQYPYIQVLPVPGINTTSDEIDNLASIYSGGAKDLYAQTYSISQSNTAIGGPGLIQYNYDFKAGITLSLVTINNILWNTAYLAERKVCAITTSINQQNINNISASVAVALSAEADAVRFLVASLTITVASIRAQVSAFAQSERAVLRALIQAIFAAAVAATEPVATLNAGLTSTGNTALGASLLGLQQAVAGLQAIANVNYNIN